MTVNLSALAGAGQQFFDNSGVPLTGGKLYSYAAGTTTPQATYTTSTGNTAHTNPIVLNSAGRVATGEIWVTAGQNYKFVLYTAPPEVLIATWDNITGINGTGIATNAEFVQYDPPYTGGVAITVENKLAQTVSVIDFGADPTGTADSTAALQAATNTGKAVFFPAGTYKMLSTVNYTGTVVWLGVGGESIIRNDSTVLNVTSGDNSSIDNLYLENITAPYIITRNPNSWATVPNVVQSNGLGYQPTANDADVWSSLTVAQQNQNIGPTLLFQGNATNIQVSRIFGRFVSILVEDARNSVVQNCNFQAGKNFAGGIVFWNINAQTGEFNRAIDNNIQYASFSGITFARNFDGLASGNIIQNVGESGIKTYQDSTGGTNAQCFRMQFENNNSIYCYFDGFDFTSEAAHTGAVDTRHLIVGNNTYGNRQIGFYADGSNNVLTNNIARATGLSGYKLFYNTSLISNNFAYGCNTSLTTSGEHQMVVDFNGNSISNNFLNPAGVTQGYSLYATGTNLVANNNGYSGVIYLGNANAVTAQTIGNTDSVYGITGSFTPTVVVGSTTQAINIQEGFYTRIGKRIFFDITLQLSSLSGTGAVTIALGGLPDPTSAGTGVYGACGNVLASNCSYSGALSWFINDNSSVLALVLDNSGTAITNITESNLTSSSKFYISGSYLANS
tara:strand:+ start:17 stop:2041 length:2025 start_codon:yes stop_codon:yes gene_type:complete